MKREDVGKERGGHEEGEGREDTQPTRTLGNKNKTVPTFIFHYHLTDAPTH